MSGTVGLSRRDELLERANATLGGSLGVYYLPDEINTVIERGVSAKAAQGLKDRGHKVVEADSPWGGAQMINIDWDRGVLIAGSEPRKDGCALGY